MSVFSAELDALKYQKDLDRELMSFVESSKEIASKTTYSPRYIVKHYERINLLNSFKNLQELLHKNDEEIKKIRKNIRKKKYDRAVELMGMQVAKYNTSLQLMNYLMMSGENFISVFSDDFEDIGYDSKEFEKLFKKTNYQSYDSNRPHGQANGRSSSPSVNRYHLSIIANPTIKDFSLLDHEVRRYAKYNKQDAELEMIEDTVEESLEELSTFKYLKKHTDWNAGSYNIFYNIKEFILKSFSYVALPMKHRIQEKELKRVSEAEFLPGDIGAIQRYGKLSNLVFKGNWTHGLLYIGKHSKFKEYFSNDLETTQVYAQKCMDLNLECYDFMSYMNTQFSDYMEDYRESEEKGRPFVTIEGLKPGVVFMELGPSMAWDNLVIIRPNLSVKDKALALERAFASLGKKYDYSFDGNSYSRFVCTELIQYAYEANPFENKKGIEWDVNMVMGKPAMYGFDLVQTYINQVNDPKRENQLSLVIYMKGIKKNALKRMADRPEFGTARRGTVKELEKTL